MLTVIMGISFSNLYMNGVVDYWDIKCPYIVAKVFNSLSQLHVYCSSDAM